MKFTVTALVAIMAATTANAAPLQGDFCGLKGQACVKIKRAFGGTSEVKRSADALAEAVEAMPEISTPRWCALPGQPCLKFKRAADAVDDVKRSADALAEATAAIEALGLE